MMDCSLTVRAVALYAKGYWFKSNLANRKIKMWFSVMVTPRSHKPEDAGSNPVAATKMTYLNW
jgi:hypothetical protein